MAPPGFPVPLIFIHGLGSNHHTWKSVIASLPKGGRYYALDLRGHGTSPLGDESDFDLEHLASDIWSLCDREKIKRVALVAHSMGCRVATLAAAHHPERIAGMMLIDMEMEPRPAPVLADSEVEKIRRIPTFFSSKERMTAVLGEHGYSSSQIEDLLKRDKIYCNIASNTYQMLFHPFTNYLAETKISASPEAKTAFASLPTDLFPLKLLIAETESCISEKGLTWMKSTYPGLATEVIPGSDHRIHKTALNVFVSSLKSFASSLS